jgi:hypothetical protein
VSFARRSRSSPAKASRPQLVVQQYVYYTYFAATHSPRANPTMPLASRPRPERVRQQYTYYTHFATRPALNPGPVPSSHGQPCPHAE